MGILVFWHLMMWLRHDAPCNKQPATYMYALGLGSPTFNPTNERLTIFFYFLNLTAKCHVR
jgi:hypothetical protein